MNIKLNTPRLAAALLASTSLVPTIAIAQSTLPMTTPGVVNPVVDDNGVDVIDGSFTWTQQDISIGKAEWGGLAYSRHRIAGGWTDNFRMFVTQATESGTNYAYVTLGPVAQKFKQVGSTWSPDIPNGATLTQSGSTWTYVAADGTIVTLVNAGRSLGARVTQIKAPSGDIQTFTYKASSTDERLQSVTTNTGWQLKFGYDNDSWTAGTATQWKQLTEATAINNASEYCDPAADSCTLPTNWVKSEYAILAGGIRSITNPGGRNWRFVESSGRVTGIRKPSSPSANTVTIGYDASGRVSSITNIAGGSWTYGYADASGQRTTTVTDQLGAKRIYVSNVAKRQLLSSKLVINNSTLDGYTTSYAYLSSGLTDSVTTPYGVVTTYEYDTRGNVTKTTASPKPGQTPAYADLITQAGYDTVCSAAVKCNKPNWTRDTANQQTDYTYNTTHGGVLTVTQPAPAGGGTRPQTRYSYTALNAYVKNASNVAVISPTAVTRLTATSECTQNAAASCVGTGYEVKSEISYNTATSGTNLPMATWSKDSKVWDVRYSVNGDLITRDGPADGTADTTRYSYNAAREATGYISPDPDGTGDLLFPATRNLYDVDGNLIEVQRGTVTTQTSTSLSTITPLEREEYSYDGLGRPLSGRLISVAYAGGTPTDTAVSLTNYSYRTDNLLDCTAVRLNPTTFASPPSSACTAATAGVDGADRITRNYYNLAKQPTQVIEGLGTTAQRNLVRYAYYADGMLRWVTDPEDNRFQYSYDGMGRVKYWNQPVPDTKLQYSLDDYYYWEYDQYGRLYRARNRNAEYTEFSYDNLSRVTLKNAPGSEPDVTYGYDLLGRMTSASQTGDSRTFAYDGSGNVLSESGPLGAISSEFNDAGLRTKLTHPTSSGTVHFSYQYDVLNRLTLVGENGLDSADKYVARYYYDDMGRLTRLLKGYGTASSVDMNYSYGPGSRLSSINYNLDTTGTANDVVLNFGNNAGAQIKSRERTNNGYAFNELGNVTRNYTVNNLNQYLTSGALNLSYDSKGNLATDGTGRTYTYDSENRLKTMVKSGAGGYTASLSYDPLGRLSQISGGPEGTVKFLWDGNMLIGEYNGSNQMIRRYVHGAGVDAPLAYYDGTGAPVGRYVRHYLQPDERGSIISVTNAYGVTEAVNTYDEHGIPSASNEGRFQYTGQLWLADIGVYYYKARVYSPTLGRFLQTDPIGHQGGMNLYGYVGGDPINSIDPTGTRTGKITSCQGSECDPQRSITIAPLPGTIVVEGGQWISDALSGPMEFPPFDLGGFILPGNFADGGSDIVVIANSENQSKPPKAVQNRCYEACYPILERWQPPGSDINQYDFNNCLKICFEEYDKLKRREQYTPVPDNGPKPFWHPYPRPWWFWWPPAIPGKPVRN